MTTRKVMAMTPPDQITQAEAALEAAGERLAAAKKGLAEATEHHDALLEREELGYGPVSVAEYSKAVHVEELAQAKREGAEKGFKKAQDQLRLAHLGLFVVEFEADDEEAGDQEAEEEAIAALVNVVTRKRGRRQRVEKLIGGMQEHGVPQTPLGQQPSEDDANLGWRIPAFGYSQPVALLGERSKTTEDPAIAVDRILKATAARCGTSPAALQLLNY